ncbi:ABC transporter permease [Herbidospora cretacea]|uniref:ABC transporter permease n=1 Tax=Herbidospora cretacea TaxID=28444 RepID=UPI0007743B4A|nr:ABC transporter permease [Herbidospora cretacea]
MSAIPISFPGAGLRTPRWATVFAWLALLPILVAAVAPELLTSASPILINPLHALLPPGGDHWFGTDQLGRDLFTRVVHGARPSLLLGLGATVLAVVAGSLLGVLAALGGRVTDQVVGRALDVLLSLPQLLLALLVITVLGGGVANVVIAIALAFTPGYARMVRTEAMVVRRSGYVEAARGLGLPPTVLVARHVLPNAVGPLLVLATVGFGTALIAGSGLSFLGFGVQPPAPEWGAMLSEGRDFLGDAWWLGLFPGAAITITVVAVNVLGRAAQRRYTRRTV